MKNKRRLESLASAITPQKTSENTDNTRYRKEFKSRPGYSSQSPVNAGLEIGKSLELAHASVDASLDASIDASLAFCLTKSLRAKQ